VNPVLSLIAPVNVPSVRWADAGVDQPTTAHGARSLTHPYAVIDPSLTEPL
jgi:hypothetical protein